MRAWVLVSLLVTGCGGGTSSPTDNVDKAQTDEKSAPAVSDPTTSDSCQPLQCKLFCLHGYVKDPSGCDTCECVSGTPDGQQCGTNTACPEGQTCDLAACTSKDNCVGTCKACPGVLPQYCIACGDSTGGGCAHFDSQCNIVYPPPCTAPAKCDAAGQCPSGQTCSQGLCVACTGALPNVCQVCPDGSTDCAHFDSQCNVVLCGK